MKLYASLTSPFARKVRISSLVLGLDKEITFVATDVYSNKPEYKGINPLYKVPSFEMRNGEVLTNSPFICEYLDSIATSKNQIIPATGPERWRALNLQSLADGMMEASVLRRYEIQRSPDKFDSKFDDRQKAKVRNTLEFFASSKLLTNQWQIAEITFFCALGYLQFRFEHENWLQDFPQVKNWYQQMCEKPEARTTHPQIT